MRDQSILWKRLDMPGHETVRVYDDGDGWCLDGSAIFLFDSKPCRLEYLVECDYDWTTTSVNIDGWVGDDVVEIDVEVEEDGRWYLNGDEIRSVEGCVDIDLNFSPVTNLLPIRRLNLEPGESKSVRAGWLRFPSFKLEPLEQVYTRIDENTVRYESDGGRFTRDLKISDVGLVTEYPDFWTVEV